MKEQGVKIPLKVLQGAKAHYEETGEPLVRGPRPGEKIYYIGFSDRQQESVLLDADVEDVEDYSEAVFESAERAFGDLASEIPTEFRVANEAIPELGMGEAESGMDCEENRLEEITFPEVWLVTLLQFWLDSKRKKICLQIAGKAKRSAELATAWYNVLINPPVSALELENSVTKGVPPAGPVTTMLLRCWARCEEPVGGGFFGEGFLLKVVGSNNEGLNSFFGFKKPSDGVLEHFFDNAAEDDAQQLLKKLRLQAEKALNFDVSSMAAPSIGKQITSARRSYSISLHKTALHLFDTKVVRR